MDGAPPLLHALRDEVHVWCAQPDALGDADLLRGLEALLSEEERARHRRFLRERDRRLFLVAHALVRRTLSRYLDVPPEDLLFRANAHGRPELARPWTAPHLRFNLSHAHGLAACAVVGELDVGIDVEQLRPIGDLESLARRTLSPEELQSLLALPAAARPDLFFTYWTLKEAYGKACGRGLSLPLRSSSFTLAGPGGASVRFAPPLEDEPETWQFFRSRPTAEHYLAVAVRRGSRTDLAVLFKTAALV